MKALQKNLESFKYLVEGKHGHKFDVNKKLKGVSSLYDVKFIGATRPDDFRKKVEHVEKLVEVSVLICGAMYAM